MSRLFFFCCALIALLVLGCGGPGVAATSLSGKEAEMHETGAASLLVGSKAYALKWADTEAAGQDVYRTPWQREILQTAAAPDSGGRRCPRDP